LARKRILLTVADCHSVRLARRPSLHRSSVDELASLGRGEPVRLVVNDEQQAVLILAEQYERLKHAIDFADADPKALYPLLADVASDDWEQLASFPQAEKL
jgi:hypothetical protein